MMKYGVQSSEYRLRARALVCCVLCALYAVLACACGGGNGNNGPVAPEAASLEGDRRTDPLENWTPAVDVSTAPTKVHGELAGYLPKEALVKNSVEYGDFNPETAKYFTDDAEQAVLPVVAAQYHSTGFDIEKDPETGARVKMEYPQKCRLMIIRAPDAVAAPVVGEKVVSALKAGKFTEISALEDAASKTDIRTIRRFTAVVPQEKHDDVYIAYLLVTGDTVIYAVESEMAEKIELEGGQVSRVEEGGRGSRVGAMLISLVTWVMDNT